MGGETRVRRIAARGCATPSPGVRRRRERHPPPAADTPRCKRALLLLAVGAFAFEGAGRGAAVVASPIRSRYGGAGAGPARRCPPRGRPAGRGAHGSRCPGMAPGRSPPIRSGPGRQRGPPISARRSPPAPQTPSRPVDISPARRTLPARVKTNQVPPSSFTSKQDEYCLLSQSLLLNFSSCLSQTG